MSKINFDELLRGDRIQLFNYIKKNIPRGKVLDIGAGSGEFVDMLKDATGVDSSFKSDKVVKMDILKYLKKMRGKVTTITAIDVLEHLEQEDVVNLFESISSKCKVFVASIPCPWLPDYFSHPYHKTLWFPNVLGKLAEANGFRWEIKMIPYFGMKFGSIRMVILNTLAFIFGKLIGKNIFMNSYLFIAKKGGK